MESDTREINEKLIKEGGLPGQIIKNQRQIEAINKELSSLKRSREQEIYLFQKFSDQQAYQYIENKYNALQKNKTANIGILPQEKNPLVEFYFKNLYMVEYGNKSILYSEAVENYNKEIDNLVKKNTNLKQDLRKL